MTNNLGAIRYAWHFGHAAVLVFPLVLTSVG
ncbi:DUF3265 domain-containing protein [Vibrio splendidus]|uniref:DUF3265 domain-containing protein n=1 Tax=Vibrio splendidus TaxID=29497 RepID=A0A7Y4D291_VIBSP|nr:DUF3265 domain-containing protein [Vibrio splendidus]NOJ11190.1 DUF3265 domain-containing protein [Vibrio splendidus]